MVWKTVMGAQTSSLLHAAVYIFFIQFNIVQSYILQAIR